MLTRPIAGHIATATIRPLPVEVEKKTKLHILDTVAAMVSGSQLNAGRHAIPYVKSLGGPAEATVIASGYRSSALWAALANGMLGHADETDDSHAPSLTHPGCAVVPAALAMAERDNRTGRDFLRAVTVGYDIGPRIMMALGGDRFFDRHHSSHSFGGLFGALAAASALTCSSPVQAAHALSYGVQMASGNSCWRRDADHVEKAFDFGGMPAQNGVQAALMAASGFSGSRDAIDGKPGLFAAFPNDANPALAAAELGETFEVMNTAIKKWCVGSPIQAALDSLEYLMSTHRIGADEIDRIVIDLPKQSAPVVDDRDMPDVCLQHQLALLLADGSITFHSGHDVERMKDQRLLSLRKRMSLNARPEQEFIDKPRQAIVTVTPRNGEALTRRTLHVRGTPHNPMNESEIVAKATDLMQPVLGSSAEEIVDLILDIQAAPSLSRLCELLRNPSNGKDMEVAAQA